MNIFKSMTLATLLVSTPYVVAGDRLPQHIGVGSGALLGALAAGPVGLAIGATFGNFIGVEQIQREQLASTQSDLSSASQRLAEVEREIERKERALAKVQDQLDQQTTKVTALKGLVQAVPMAMLFETQSAELAEEYRTPIQALAKATQSFDDLQIRVQGHTDTRGDAQTNQALSEARAAVVSDELVQQGAAPSAIQWVGYGEEKATGRYAKDRRVELRLDFGVPRSALFSAN